MRTAGYADGTLKVHVRKKYEFTLDGVKQAQRDFEKDPNRGKRIIAFEAE